MFHGAGEMRLRDAEKRDLDHLMITCLNSK